MFSHVLFCMILLIVQRSAAVIITPPGDNRTPVCFSADWNREPLGNLRPACSSLEAADIPDAEYMFVLQVIMSHGDQFRGCSGFKLRPWGGPEQGQVIMTAGHCFWLGQNILDQAFIHIPGEQLPIVVNKGEGSIFWTALPPASLLGHRESDWGFIWVSPCLDEPSKALQKAVSLDRDLVAQVNGVINVAGYPEKPPAGLGVGLYHSSSADAMVIPNDLVQYTAATSEGQSGGPVWRGEGEQRRIVAIHVAANRAKTFNEGSDVDPCPGCV